MTQWKWLPTIALLGLVVSCSNPQQAGTNAANATTTAETVANAAGGTPAAVSGVAASALLGQCTALAPTINAGVAAGAGAAPTSAKGALAAAASFGQAYCAQLEATGAPPATTTSTTPAWLTSVVQTEQVLAPIAGVVLPLVLSAVEAPQAEQSGAL